MAWLILALWGCAPSPPSPYPADAAEALTLRAAGEAWTDREARAWYLLEVARIPAIDAALQAEGRDAEARARAAWAHRKHARLGARAMMSDPAEVEALRQRDRELYGDPDGPTFEWLTARAAERGLEGDAVWLWIVDSAGRTNPWTDLRLGLRPAAPASAAR